ncbi:FUSC family protein [Herbiconiux moechotypicola]|uniref:Aromatic acid exporter family protein n=1 Tax=Herbiconiux moechotypicola TaxID=637393 RepID=A0ABN3DWX9_9MICO|nr:FUSC family protein [Herbiconiux moechotypicola]MCS5730918.1 FUSC family protein [Herbiconiux moechotypicola]
MSIRPSDPAHPRWRRFGAAAAAPVRTFLSTKRAPLLQVLKTAAAAVLAWVACSLVDPAQIPVFGAIAAIIVVQPSVNQSFSRALERSIGVVVGVIVAFLVTLVFGAPSWLILVAIVVSLLVGWVLRFPASSLIQIPISAMLVLSIGAATPGYAVARIFETVIGAVIGVIINWLIVPPLATTPAREAVERLGHEVAATMDGLAIVLSRSTDAAFRAQTLVEARLLRPMQAKAQAAIDTAEESLRFNPRRSGSRERLRDDAALLTMLGIVVSRVLGMARALNDHFDETLHEEPTAKAIGEELRRAAHDLRLVIDQSGLPEGEAETLGHEEPLLTAPLQAIVPDPAHWILIGSLLEDLRRVREEIVGAVPPPAPPAPPGGQRAGRRKPTRS